MTSAPLWLHLLVIALASARLSVLLVHDTILERPRDWLHRHRPPVDNPILGFDYQQRDTDGERLPDGVIRDASLLGELFTCTRCMSVWTTAATIVLYQSGWNHARDIVAALAVMGVASMMAKKV